MVKFKINILSLILFCLIISAAQAQVTVDVSKITCEQFMGYVITDPNNIALWLSGYHKKLEKAIEQYRNAAERGYAAAQTELANAYSGGIGVAKDDAQAVAWYRTAAEQGVACAQNNLGFMYTEDRGVAKDDAQAVAWLRKAAEQGIADAQYNLG